MAIHQVVVSDLSGAEGAQPVRLSLGDAWHSLDLTPAELQTLEQVLQPYVAVAQQVQPTCRHRGSTIVPEMTVEERKYVREWATEQGLNVPRFGRLPKVVLAAYADAYPQA